MTNKSMKYAISFVLAITLIWISPNPLTAKKKKKRFVTIKWNATPGKEKLEVTTSMDDKDDSNNYLFELKSNDKVLLELEAERNAKLEIKYKITGPDTVAEFKKGIPLFLEPQTAENDSKLIGKKKDSDTKVERMAITDDLIPGGTLEISFKKTIQIQGKEVTTNVTRKVPGKTTTEKETIKKTEASKEKISEKTLIFRVKDKPPWFFTSTGFVFTNESNHRVAFIKTSMTTTVEDKEGNSEEVFVQKIGFKDKDDKNKLYNLRPKQTLVQFIHFKLYRRMYLSFGVPVNNKIFTEPLTGISYYNKFKKIGYAITAGVHFHKEITIDELSGFKLGDVIDPSKLTVEEIPTNSPYKLRFFIGISFRL